MEEINNQYFTMFTKKKIEYELSKAGYSTSNKILTAPSAKFRKAQQNISPHFFHYYRSNDWSRINIVSLFDHNDILNVSDLQKLLPENAHF